MGNSNDIDTNNKFRQCTEIEEKNSNWAGRHTILQDPTRVGKILKKSIYLRNHKEASSFVSNFKEQDKPEFYVIDPLYVELIKQDGLCALSQSVNVYHKPLLPNLANRMNLMKQSFKQKQIWFILSQISHSLQILHGRGHPHLWISPQTIYYNKDDNWFLQDMHYWRGSDYQNLINDKSQNQQLMSNYMRKISQKSEMIDLSIACDEDIYCFGYTLIAMMSGLSLGQIQKNSHVLLEQCMGSHSKKLVNLVKSMIQQIPERRLTLEKLRFKLKMDEQQIIKEEIAEFKRHNHLKVSGQNHKIQLSKFQQHDNQNIKSSKIFHPPPTIPNTTHHLTPHSNLTTHQNSPFYVQTNRKTSMYYSPPTHRVFTEARSPSQQKYKRVVNQFRFNSPRN